ncbi:M48 family metallopeptidase [Herbaspirillum sp. GCM10030257]|uniref:M48 family metallopeptidase n=1 Tax=Herbaspirillum sp. GCM10030257 TaxID=3273393 RepID=UPI00360953B7
MIDAYFYDGNTTRRHTVQLLLHKGILAVSGEGVRRSVRLSKVRVSERLEHAPRILHLPEGGYIESSDAGLEKLLRRNGYREPRVVRWQRNWPLSLCALVSLLVILIAGYQWGLPWAADTLAQNLPPSMEKRIGDEQLRLIDSRWMEPSRQSVEEQTRIRKLFAGLRQPRGEQTPYRLEFRHSKMGPNAFALPNGVIVMTDELVKLAASDQAVLGVLGHELGHVQRRHSLRRLLQALGVGVVINLFIGDVSSALAAVPTFLLDQKYSRDFEREADQYAIDMMHANAVPLSPMAELFEKMGAAHSHRAASASSDEDEDGIEEDADHAEESTPSAPESTNGRRDGQSRAAKSFEYLSSHPSDEERIKRLKAADGKAGAAVAAGG